MSKIILTGGGTAGHVTPNIALLPSLRAKNVEVLYVGSKYGIERELATAAGIPFHAITTGKFRRYLSTKNFTDAFRVIKGLSDAYAVVKKFAPDVIFSKGGFVGAPVALSGRLAHIPVVIHESDLTPGLANKLSYPFATAVCVTFKETLPFAPRKKTIHTGAPIREELTRGDRKSGLALCGFSGNRPVLLIMGGSSGSTRINNIIAESIENLTSLFDVIHIIGKGNPKKRQKGYAPFEYVNKELSDIFSASDICVSRAGSNTISELLAVALPMLLIPLSKRVSRGDQILNAHSFVKNGFAMSTDEDTLTPEKLFAEVKLLFEQKDSIKSNMLRTPIANGVDNIMVVLDPFFVE